MTAHAPDARPAAAGAATEERAFLRAVLLVLFAVVAVRTSWISDDAYVSFRTVENLLSGDGATWNPFERVQAFTNPLWMFLVTCCSALTGEMFYTVHALSIATSAAAVWLLLARVARGAAGLVLAGVLLVASRAFVDYSSSGLENPLTHLLLVAFVERWVREGDRAPRRVLHLALLAGLAALNRHDTILLLAPALLVVCARRHRLGLPWVRALVAGVSPMIVWTLFSLWYFGFPFPNTAYAKLNTGLPRDAVWGQGLLYFVESLGSDPVTLTAIAGAAALAWTGRRARARGVALSLGIALTLVYVARVGGDFMSGRFFAAPFVVGVAMLARHPAARRGMAAWGLVAAAAALAFAAPWAPWRSDRSYGVEGDAAQLISPSGIADERAVYYRSSGLLRASRFEHQPHHDWVDDGLEARATAAAGDRWVVLSGTVGYFGYFAGPDVLIVDYHALSDPLLARLPSNQPRDWRPGHFKRDIPAGYPESVLHGENRLEDPDLARYYDKLLILTQGDLWSGARLVEIVKFNLGAYDAWRDAYVARWRRGEARATTPGTPRDVAPGVAAGTTPAAPSADREEHPAP